MNQIEGATFMDPNTLRTVLIGTGPTIAGSTDTVSTDQAFGTIPKSIGRYRIIRELGRGGMGVVFAALDSVLDAPVALKVLPRVYVDNADDRYRLLKEARSAALMRHHPNVVTIYEANTDGPIPYVAMEYVEGVPLSAWIARRRQVGIAGDETHVKSALAIACGIAAGLAEAHRRGLVHRDIKPNNVMVTDETRIKILDFGIAKRLASGMSRTGMIAGTPLYMAPELLAIELGLREDDDALHYSPRLDVYALGVTLYEMLALRNPWESIPTVGALLKAKQCIVGFDDLPRLPFELSQAIQRSLESMILADPGRRCPDGQRALELLLEERAAGPTRAAAAREHLEAATAPEAPTRMAGAPKGGGWPLSVVVVAILLCVAIVMMQTIQFRGKGMRAGLVASLLSVILLLTGAVLLSFVYRLGSLAHRRAPAQSVTPEGLPGEDLVMMLNKEHWAQGPTLLDFEEVYWLGDRCIMVYCGDIAELTAEALVSSDDNYLSMGGGVSARIRAVGGDTIRDEAQRQRPAKIGDVIVTTAGRLGSRYVLHAVVIDLDQRLLPSLEAISTTTRQVFKRADALDVKSIAVPALGAGVGGLPLGDVMRVLVEAMVDVLRHRESSLRSIVFAYRGAQLIDEFREQILEVTEGKVRIQALPGRK